jgi:hypothetical protein
MYLLCVLSQCLITGYAVSDLAPTIDGLYVIGVPGRILTCRRRIRVLRLP